MEYKQSQENTKHTNIRLSIETYKRIEILALENERNVSQQIRFMLEKYLDLLNNK